LDKIGGKPAHQAVEATIQRHFEVMDEYKQLMLLERHPKEVREPWIIDVCPSMYKGNVSWQIYFQRHQSTLPSKDILEQRLFPGPL
jgi:hypothetical protein